VIHSGPATTHARERTLAVATLALARAVDEATLAAALQDPEGQVRREAAAAAAALADTAQVGRITRVAATDSAPAVRYEAVRVYAARLGAVRGCGPVVAAARDPSMHVSLLAIGLLGTTCRAPSHAGLLDSIAALAATGADGWHRAAHAAVALASIDAGRARVRAGTLARHPSPFARTYAARAAAAAADGALLYRLVHDESANVRTAAVAGLAAVAGHAADSIFTTQLTSDESELLMAASAALEGSRTASAADRLLDALDRVSGLERETSRDARIALLERVGELGGASLAGRVEPYLRDFDEAVASRAADVLEAWTGERPPTAPTPLPPLPLPTYAEAMALARTSFVLEMARGGEIDVRLLPFAAPTNAARFARLARSGYFDGLTIHRVAPNFVVQGGSPGANEYSGDGPFTRDELSVPNWRGTVGLSTRGRDTGDAQFYINLIDNVRLDHEYTVFGVVVQGMAVVDGVLEGAVIRRVREQPVR
jgi:cyclophilin family peptidyl-prolyl cis-trans isomerase